MRRKISDGTGFGSRPRPDSDARAGKAGDGCGPPSEGQGIRKREIILHRFIGPLGDLG